jgi:hypothetical protein
VQRRRAGLAVLCGGVGARPQQQVQARDAASLRGVTQRRCLAWSCTHYGCTYYGDLLWLHLPWPYLLWLHLLPARHSPAVRGRSRPRPAGLRRRPAAAWLRRRGSVAPPVRAVCCHARQPHWLRHLERAASAPPARCPPLLRSAVPCSRRRPLSRHRRQLRTEEGGCRHRHA